MRRLLLACHAVTDWNRAGRYQGHADIGLNDDGVRQADRLASALAHEAIAGVISSDLRRARETASAIVPPHRLAPSLEPRLRELNFGAWEGWTYGEIQERDAAAFQSWQADPIGHGPPGGESLAELADRVGDFWGEIVASSPDDRSLLIVAHRGSLRVMMCLALGVPIGEHWRFPLKPASLSILAAGGGRATLIALNDTTHLREAGHAC